VYLHVSLTLIDSKMYTVSHLRINKKVTGMKMCAILRFTLYWHFDISITIFTEWIQFIVCMKLRDRHYPYMSYISLSV